MATTCRVKRIMIMKKVLFLLPVLLIVTIKSLMANQELIIASVPWRETEILQKIYAPLLTLLRQEFIGGVTFHVTSDYAELGERLNSGAADLGIFGGNSYVETKERFPSILYLATCKQPDDHYFSYVIVHKSSGITSLADMKGMSFGFSDRGSTSGYVYPLLMMSMQGFIPERHFARVYFLEKHDKVYDAVAKRAVDGGGVSSTAYDKAVSRNGDIFRIIEKSEPIPRNPIVAGGHVSAESIDRIRKILISAEESPVFKNSDSILKGFTIKSDSFYNVVREARKINE